MSRPPQSTDHLSPWVAPSPPAEPAELFERDMRLALKWAGGVFVAGLVLVALAGYLLELSDRTLRLAMFAAVAPLTGAVAWLAFMCVVGLILMLAGVELTKDQSRRVELFPAWQFPGGMGAAGRARVPRVVAFLGWWMLCALALLWVRSW